MPVLGGVAGIADIARLINLAESLGPYFASLQFSQCLPVPACPAVFQSRFNRVSG